LVDLAFKVALLGDEAIDVFDQFRLGDAEDSGDAVEGFARGLEVRDGAFAGDGLDAADAG